MYDVMRKALEKGVTISFSPIYEDSIKITVYKLTEEFNTLSESFIMSKAIAEMYRDPDSTVEFVIDRLILDVETKGKKKDDLS